MQSHPRVLFIVCLITLLPRPYALLYTTVMLQFSGTVISCCSSGLYSLLMVDHKLLATGDDNGCIKVYVCVYV